MAQQVTADKLLLSPSYSLFFKNLVLGSFRVSVGRHFIERRDIGAQVLPLNDQSMAILLSWRENEKKKTHLCKEDEAYNIHF